MSLHAYTSLSMAAVQRTWRNVDAAQIGTPSDIDTTVIVNAEDTSGEQAWRARQPHTCQVTIPTALLIAGDSQDFDMFAHEHDTFVFPLYKLRADGEPDFQHTANGRVFGIWGAKDKASATYQAIDAWIQRETPSRRERGSSHFQKVQPMTDKQRDRDMKKFARQVKQHIFRQHPEDGASFKSIGTFRWPNCEPMAKDALGHSLEALDSIRMKHCCYIITDDDGATIKLLGDLNDVQAAFVKVRKTYFQITARQHTAPRDHLLHWSSTDRAPSGFELVKYARPISTRESTARIELPSYRVAGWNAEPAVQPAASLNHLASVLQQTISSLQYYSGHVQFRVRLGTFLLTTFLPPADGHYSLSAFDNMLHQTQFQGRVTEELGLPKVEHKLLAILQKVNCLEPMDLMVESKSNVLPVYTAVCTYESSDNNYQLLMSWQEAKRLSGPNQFFAIKPRWSKLQSPATTSSKFRLLDVNLLRPESNMAWHFDMSATHSVIEQRLPSKISGMAKNIKLDEDKARDHHVSMPLFIKLPSTSDGLRSVKCYVIYQYRIDSSVYVLEASHFRAWHNIQPLSTHHEMKPKQEARWSVSIYNPQWDKYLSENSDLAVGEQVEWTDDFQEWFPPEADTEGRGLMQLLDRMQHVEDVLIDA